MIRNDVYDDLTSESDFSDSDESVDVPPVLSQASSQPSSMPLAVTADAEASKAEIRETLRRGFNDEKCDVNVVGLEITGVKYATNVTYHHVLDVIVGDVLSHYRKKVNEQNKVGDLIGRLAPWTELWKKFAPETNDMEYLLCCLSVHWLYFASWDWKH